MTSTPRISAKDRLVGPNGVAITPPQSAGFNHHEGSSLSHHVAAAPGGEVWPQPQPGLPASGAAVSGEPGS